MKAALLLRHARSLYDNPELPFERSSRSSWQRGFASGAAWMELSLATLRQSPVAKKDDSSYSRFQGLGWGKYAVALLRAFFCSVATLSTLCLLSWKTYLPELSALANKVPLPLFGNIGGFSLLALWLLVSTFVFFVCVLRD